MPDTVTIYWNGYAPVPEEIINLPAEQRTFVLTKVKERREELLQESPVPYIIGMGLLMIFFLIVALYPRSKQV